MKRWIAVLSLLFVVIVSTVSTQQAAAQTAVLPDSSWNLFRVTKGSWLYAFADTIYGNGNKWETLFRTNVAAEKIPASALHYKDGIPYVDLAVGQEVYLPKAAPDKLKGIEPVAPSPQLRVENMQVPPVPPIVKSSTDLTWLWWLLAAIVALYIVSRIISRKLANPVTSGRPMREGGINDETAPNYFQTMASNRTGTPGSSSYIAPERIRVINMRRGRGYGMMRVTYNDPSRPNGRREEVKNLTGEIVYEATVQFPDDHQETMFCLQACANDIVYLGNRNIPGLGFRFDADTGAIHTSQPQTTVSANGTNIDIRTDEITVTHQGHTITFGADGWKIGAAEDGGLVLSGKDRHDVLFRDGRVHGAPIVKRVRSAPAAKPVQASRSRRSVSSTTKSTDTGAAPAATADVGNPDAAVIAAT